MIAIARLTVSFLLIALVLCANGSANESRVQLEKKQQAELNVLAKQAVAANQTALAKKISQLFPEAKSGELILFNPNDFPKESGTLLNIRAEEHRLVVDFLALRQKHAKERFELAKKMAAEGHTSDAIQLCVETLRYNPGHAGARRVLGFQKQNDRWVTEFEKAQLKRSYTWHTQFGWIKKADVGKYEAGERPRGRRWISAAEDVKRHSTVASGWVIRTEHFVVKTNVGREAGVELAGRLEAYHAIWQQLYAGYFLSDNKVKDLLDGKSNTLIKGRPHRVNYYKSRDEYNKALVKKQPKIAMTLGIYFDRDKQSHFFAGEDQLPSTIYHEITHQLFNESISTHRNPGSLDNFWMIEGIATYIESFQKVKQKDSITYYTLGNPENGRLLAAQANFLNDRYYVRFQELVSLGKNEIQNRNDLQKLYSQFAGVATFLMHAENGKYREPLIDYMRKIYTGKDDAETLSKLTKKSYSELDEEYARFLKPSS